MRERRAGHAHDRLAAEAARDPADCDAIAFARFSLARAADAVAAGKPVFTAPDSTVRKLKRLLAA